MLARIDGVLECAVVAAPDARFGEHACAFIRGTAPSMADVQAAMSAAGLARQKWPEEIREIAEFPRTASGKIQKFVLRQQWARRRLLTKAVGLPRTAHTFTLPADIGPSVLVITSSTSPAWNVAPPAGSRRRHRRR